MLLGTEGINHHCIIIKVTHIAHSMRNVCLSFLFTIKSYWRAVKQSYANEILKITLKKSKLSSYFSAADLKVFIHSSKQGKWMVVLHRHEVCYSERCTRFDLAHLTLRQF